MNDTPFIKKGRFTLLSVVLMFLLPIATALICLCVGRMSVPLGDVLRAIQSLFTGETAGAQNYSIIVNLRLPRILMAIVVGAGLTCAGNTYQALFSNPLATPDILGVTSGTCVGAILAIILSCSIFETQMIALALPAFRLVYAENCGQKQQPLDGVSRAGGRHRIFAVQRHRLAAQVYRRPAG